MMKFGRTKGDGYLDWWVIIRGLVIQVTWWKSPPAVYSGVELHWWRGRRQ